MKRVFGPITHTMYIVVVPLRLLHGFEHIYSVFGVALSDLLQCFVLIATLCDVLAMQDVVSRDLRLIFCLS